MTGAGPVQGTRPDQGGQDVGGGHPRPVADPQPYYSDELVTLYHGPCEKITEWLSADVLVTDPPYGIRYKSGSRREVLADSIEGDQDTSLRDEALEMWGDRSALVFGSWRAPRPAGVVSRLIWDTKGALGMGDLRYPWKPSDQESYVLGSPGGFAGRRTSNVLTHAPVQSMARGGRIHPHQKPLSLMTDLIAKTVGTIADPFAGSGSTLVAAKMLGRRAIGVESDERYLPIIVARLQQDSIEFAQRVAAVPAPPLTRPQAFRDGHELARQIALDGMPFGEAS